MFLGPDPGRKDLILADFQAKLLAGGRQDPDPVEERMVRSNRMIIRWAVVAVLVASVLTWFFEAEIAAIGSIALVVAALLLAWRSSRRTNAQRDLVNDQL